MNALKHETSPYLLQHADNPVDWQPWSEAAFELARERNVPVLLSIGYSACHWCHVMAHESFEDAATAERMNRQFVNIKVDREERPDIDRIYQSAHQLMQRRPGGWPLTVFLDPEDQRPYFVGTYFPKTPSHGMPSFTDLLDRASEHFRDHRDAVRDYGKNVVAALTHIDLAQPAEHEALSGHALDAVRATLTETADREHGGFGCAPKFPHPTNIERLMRHWRNTNDTGEPDQEALFLCALTLTRMAEGGIYDQIGGGFCRYAVDAQWMIPHFEKMLYDNGQLLPLYAQFWQISGDDDFRRVALATADWLCREMRSPEGVFYSALDADSEGHEGKFYVWHPDEVRALLTEDEFAVFAPRFGLDGSANFEGQWHLRVTTPIEALAERTGQAQAAVQRLIDTASGKLLDARAGRVRPGLDDKILTSWNALVIRGLAITSRVFQDESMATTASKALDFIARHMRDDGQLYATSKNGVARFNAYLDDYAFLLDATLELLQARWNTSHLELAIWLADRLLEKFSAPDGGFYFTADDHEALIHRGKPMSDEAVPSGNAIAALGLQRLGLLLGERRCLDAAAATVQAAGSSLDEYPHAHTALINAIDEIIAPGEIVILRGGADEVRRWAWALGAVYTPKRLIFAIPDDAEALPEALAVRKPAAQTIAYICRGTACTPPLTSLDDIAAELRD